MEAHVELDGIRKKTKSVPLSTEPVFNSEFLFPLGKKSDELNNLESLLSTQEKIKIIITKTTSKDVTVLSNTVVEWRNILCGRRWAIDAIMNLPIVYNIVFTCLGSI